ncbi:hypothetical protein KXW37_004137, partial [Aspergillus fumigatus]
DARRKTRMEQPAGVEQPAGRNLCESGRRTHVTKGGGGLRRRKTTGDGWEKQRMMQTGVTGTRHGLPQHKEYENDTRLLAGATSSLKDNSVPWPSGERRG